jgi:hypothetical protein
MDLGDPLEAFTVSVAVPVVVGVKFTVTSVELAIAKFAVNTEFVLLAVKPDPLALPIVPLESVRLSVSFWAADVTVNMNVWDSFIRILAP